MITFSHSPGSLNITKGIARLENEFLYAFIPNSIFIISIVYNALIHEVVVAIAGIIYRKN